MALIWYLVELSETWLSICEKVLFLALVVVTDTNTFRLGSLDTSPTDFRCEKTEEGKINVNVLSTEIIGFKSQKLVF